jgi:hypothetical protein
MPQGHPAVLFKTIMKLIIFDIDGTPSQTVSAAAS